MSHSQTRQLQQLARLEGIQTSYITMAGAVQHAPPETIMAILATLGHPIHTPDDIGSAWTEARRRIWQSALEPVVVAWDGRPIEVSVRLPANFHNRSLRSRLLLEEPRPGKEKLGPVRPAKGELADIDGARYRLGKLRLPSMPLGYHRLEMETPSGLSKCLVIAAPSRSYSVPGRTRQWGVFLPIYAAHSEKSWGAGNFGDWERLVGWTGALKGDFVASLPLLAAFLDATACEPSPYSPATRLFWNEFYIDWERVPELERCPAARRLMHSVNFQKTLGSFRQSREIDYARQWALRRSVLDLLAKCFFSTQGPRRADFQRFLESCPEAEDFARFRAAGERHGRSWHVWPRDLRDGQLRPEDYAQGVERSFAYAQWIAQRQVEHLLSKCRGAKVSVYLDLPLGVHPDGYDVWRHRDAFVTGVSAGAPPDAFFSKGQNWGFSPPHPRATREQGYAYLVKYLQFQMKHAGLLRIDHVMGLHRLYWVPQGFPPSQGAYVTYRPDELYAVLSLESHRHQTGLVGENLGTVPPSVNQAMERHRLRQMYVLQYEQHPAPGRALRRPPARSVASINTHDMPTFAAHWKGLDLADRVSLGLIPRHELARYCQGREKLNAALADFLQKQRCLKSGNVPQRRRRGTPPDVAAALRACLRWLSASPAEVVLINLEDLWLEELPQNVPGTSYERPNWRRKSALTVEEIAASARLRRILKEVDRLRHE
jgi:4-alpha-glucanotransferase